MSALERVWRLFEPPTVERTVYECRSCGSRLGADASSCTECGGEVTELVEPIDYTYWGPYH